MPVDYQLNKGDELPVFWVDEIQEFLSGLAPAVHLSMPNNTSVRVDTDAHGRAVPISGLWRYITASQSVVHPGGAAGVYDIVLVASGNDIVNSPDPLTDDTDYNFYPEIVPTGTAPVGNTPAGNAIQSYRKVGECDWDGAKITGLRQVLGATDKTLPAQPTAPDPGAWALRVKGAVGQSADILRVESNDGNTAYLRVSPTGVTASSLTAGATSLTSTLNVTGAATLQSTLAVTGTSTFTGTVTTNGGIISDQNIALNSGASLLTAQAAASVVLANQVNVGDDNNTFQIDGSGSISWGPGGAGALDTILSRSGFNTLGVSGGLSVDGGLIVAGQVLLLSAGLALEVSNNATVGGTLDVTGASTLTGLVTGKAGLTLDAGVGTATQTITLIGRNAGVANTATISVSSIGQITYNTPNAGEHLLEVGGASTLAVTGTGLTLSDARDIVVGTGTGTKIGTSSAQKLGFYGAAPAVQINSPIQARVNSATNVTGGTAPAALSVSSTLGDVIAWVSRVANALQSMGLLGTNTNLWTS